MGCSLFQRPAKQSDSQFLSDDVREKLAHAPVPAASTGLHSLAPSPFSG